MEKTDKTTEMISLPSPHLTSGSLDVVVKDSPFTFFFWGGEEGVGGDKATLIKGRRSRKGKELLK